MKSHSDSGDPANHTNEALGLLVRRRELKDALAVLEDAQVRSGPSSAAEEYERLHAVNRKNDAIAELELVERKLRELGVDGKDK